MKKSNQLIFFLALVGCLITSPSAFSQPVNDACPGLAIGDLPFVDFGSTANASQEFANCLSNSAPDVFFTFYNSECTDDVTVSLCGSYYDTALEILDGCFLNSLYCEDDSFCDEGDGLQSSITFTPEVNTSYYIRVFGFASNSGDYTISVTREGSPPLNDNCFADFPNVALINSLPYTDTGSTCRARNDFSVCGMGSSPDVIYALQLDSCYEVTVSLCNSSYDTRLAVLIGSCPGITEIACNDDYCGLQSSVTFTANHGAAYFVVVGGFHIYSGDYELNVSGTLMTPANDNCLYATTVGSLPYSETGSTRCALQDHGDPNCDFSNSRDVFYRLNIPTCENVRVSLCGSSFDTRLEVRSGGACPGNELVTCNDDFCGFQSEVTFVAQAYTDYFIKVCGVIDGAEGEYLLNITSLGTWIDPANTCSGVTILSLPFSNSGNTTCATDDYANCVEGEGPEVVYSFTNTVCQEITATTCIPDPAYDTGLEVRWGSACPGDNSLVCNDDDPDCGDIFPQFWQSTATFYAQPGQNYYFIVHGFHGQTGPYSLTVTGNEVPPPNNVCDGTLVTSVPYVDHGVTDCANDDYPNNDCHFEESSPEVVYNLRLPATQDVQVTTCGSNYDTGLKVRTGGACPGDEMVVCNDDAVCDDVYGLMSGVEFTALAGIDYYIQVSGFQLSEGLYKLQILPTMNNPVDSLAIILNTTTNMIDLHWEDTGASRYFIFRSEDPDPENIYENLFQFTTSPGYTDPWPINSLVFYSVTAIPEYMTPALLAAGLGERPIQEVLDEARANLKATAAWPQPADYHPYQNRNAAYNPVDKVVHEATSDVVVNPYIAIESPFVNEERADVNKQHPTKETPVHSFGPGTSIEMPVPGKDYSKSQH